MRVPTIDATPALGLAFQSATITELGWNYLHFVDEDMNIQRGCVILARWPSTEVAEQGLKPWSF